MPHTYADEIYSLAESQDGYFTSPQARRVGISAQALVMMERRGSLERPYRGLYRLAKFPPSRYDAYREAILYIAAVNEKLKPVLSHESALLVYKLSDVNPISIHLTIPPTTRIRRILPPALTLHATDLDDADHTFTEGLPITSVERTLRDCHKAHVGPAIFYDAMNSAIRQGYLTPKSAEALRKDLR